MLDTIRAMYAATYDNALALSDSELEAILYAWCHEANVSTSLLDKVYLQNLPYILQFIKEYKVGDVLEHTLFNCDTVLIALYHSPWWFNILENFSDGSRINQTLLKEWMNAHSADIISYLNYVRVEDCLDEFAIVREKYAENTSAEFTATWESIMPLFRNHYGEVRGYGTNVVMADEIALCALVLERQAYLEQTLRENGDDRYKLVHTARLDTPLREIYTNMTSRPWDSVLEWYFG